MGKMLGLLFVVGILGAATAAFANDTIYRMTGTIKSVDLMQHLVTLKNGSTYKAAQGVNIKGLKEGQKVTLTYSGFGGSVEASRITPAED
jgi:Cu/Ag efflux protein CusF